WSTAEERSVFWLDDAVDLSATVPGVGPVDPSHPLAVSGDTMPPVSTATPSDVAMNILPDASSAAHRVAAVGSPCRSPNSTSAAAAYLYSPAPVDIQTASLLSTITFRTSRPVSSSPASSPSLVILCTPLEVASQIIPCRSSAIECTSNPDRAE